MQNQKECDCDVCKKFRSLLEQFKGEETEMILFACLKVVGAKAKELAAERQDITHEDIVVTLIDKLAEQAGFIREVSFTPVPQDTPPKTGLH